MKSLNTRQFWIGRLINILFDIEIRNMKYLTHVTLVLFMKSLNTRQRFKTRLEQLAKYLGSGNKVTINTQHISSVYEES